MVVAVVVPYIVPFYKDLTKVTKDLLTDDYGLKRTLKVKHTSPQGVGFTVENEHKKGNVVGKVQVKYAHKPSGFSLDKVTLNPDGSKIVECSLLDVAPGLKLTAKVDDAVKGDLGFEYWGNNFALKTEMDIEASSVQASATMAYQQVIAGGMLSYKLPGDKPATVQDYNAGLTYGGYGWFAALTTSDKMATFNASAAYTPSKNVTGVAVASVTPEKNTQTVTVGAKYVCNPKTTLRAKATSEGLLSAAVTHRCVPTMLIGAATEVHAKDMQPKFGFNITLG